MAFESVELRLGTLSGPDWKATDIGLKMDWAFAPAATYHVSVGALKLPALAQPLRGLTVQCQKGKIEEGRIACDDAKAHIAHSFLDRPYFRLAFHWDAATGQLRLKLKDLPVASGKLQLKLTSGSSEWRASIKGRSIDLQRLKKLALSYLALDLPWEATGKLAPEIQIRGSEEGIQVCQWDAHFQHVGGSDASADYQAEDLGGHISGRLRYSRSRWFGDASLQLTDGALLTPQFYLAPTEAVVDLQTGFSFTPGRKTLEIHSLRYSHPRVFEVDLSGAIDLAKGFAIDRLSLQTGLIELQTLYAEYLQPILAESILENLVWDGQARLNIDYSPTSGRRGVLEFNDVDVEAAMEDADRPKPFGFNGINGRLIWTGGEKIEVSRVNWHSGHLLEKITLGATQVDLSLGEQGVRLLEPTEIPMLDGKLLVDRFSVSAAPRDAGRVEFEGVLTPVSLETISGALDWPVLAGQLSGIIPGISYQEGRVEVAGTLLVRAFGGNILVKDLSIQDLFGVFPMLNADVEMKDLNLETLTSTFSFGKITGKLEGRIRGLQLEDWNPVAFEARFATPKGDRSRRRISQRAVDNISNLGGAGVSGAVSRSFLRFFEDFGYKRLGISCRLENDVCEMGGVGAADNGYYLIEGGGIPRISIIGYNRHTDWGRLLNQLREIAKSGPPVVE